MAATNPVSTLTLMSDGGDACPGLGHQARQDPHHEIIERLLEAKEQFAHLLDAGFGRQVPNDFPAHVRDAGRREDTELGEHEQTG